MSKKRWFRFYIERWRDGTFGLTPNEVAAYITILCELYDHDGNMCVLDHDLLSRRCGMRPSSFRKALETLVARRKLTLEGEFVSSKAVYEEVKSREKLDDKSAESRKNLAGKRNEINGFLAKIPSNKEERIKNITFLEVSALHPKEGALEEARRRSAAAVAGLLKRREMYKPSQRRRV